MLNDSLGVQLGSSAYVSVAVVYSVATHAQYIIVKATSKSILQLKITLKFLFTMIIGSLVSIK